MSRRKRQARSSGTSSSITQHIPSTPGRPFPLLFGVIILAVHLLLLGLTLGRYLDPFFNDAKHRIGLGSDFYAYYNAGRNWVAGNGAYGHGPGFGFRYHPLFAATIGVTLSQTSPKIAFALWCLIHEIAILWLAGYLWRLMPRERDFMIASSVLALFSPLYLEIFMGNSSFLAGVGLLVAFAFYERKKLGKSGMLIAASILTKPLGLVCLPVLAMRKHLLLVGAICAAVSLGALPFFLFNQSDLLKLYRVNFTPSAPSGWVMHGGNQGFWGFVANLCIRFSNKDIGELSSLRELPQGYPILLTMIPGAFVFATTFFSWISRENIYVCLFLWICTYLLGYKDVWEHSYSILIPALVWLWQSRTLPPWVVLIAAIIEALPTAFFFYDVNLPPGPFDPERYWNNSVSYFHHGTKSIPLLGLYLLTCFTLGFRRDRRFFP